MLNFLTQPLTYWRQQTPVNTNDTPQPETSKNCTTAFRRHPEMTEFLQTYIYPGGKHPDGTALSPAERRSAVELTHIVHSLTTHTPPGIKPLKLDSWPKLTTGLLYLFSGLHNAFMPPPVGSSAPGEFYSLTNSAKTRTKASQYVQPSPRYDRICHNLVLNRELAPTQLSGQPTQQLLTYTNSEESLSAWEEYTEKICMFRDQVPKREGSKIFHSHIHNPIEYLKKLAKIVLHTLYTPLDDALPEKTEFIFTLCEMKDKAAIVYPPHDTISLSLDISYIEEFFARHGSEKLEREIRGMLLHELTHIYQLAPQSTAPGDQGAIVALLEGLADAVRASNELTARNRPIGGHYMKGFVYGGYFFAWIRENYDQEFIRKLNRSIQKVTPWSFNGAIKYILGQEYDVDELWQTYQTELKFAHHYATQNSSALKTLP